MYKNDKNDTYSLIITAFFLSAFVISCFLFTFFPLKLTVEFVNIYFELNTKKCKKWKNILSAQHKKKKRAENWIGEDKVRYFLIEN